MTKAIRYTVMAGLLLIMLMTAIVASTPRIATAEMPLACSGRTEPVCRWSTICEPGQSTCATDYYYFPDTM